jgi:hypothetical protein
MSKLDRRSFFGAAIAGTLASPLALAAASKQVRNPSQRATPITGTRSRNTVGKMLYISDDGSERGREWFGFTYRPDGQVTLRAYCEIDDTRVERDVVQSMNAQFHPLDCFVRLHVGGKFLGTGWIRVMDEEAECEVSSIQLGRVHQRMHLDAPVRSLVSHPITSDGLLMAEFDHSKPQRIQTWPAGLSTSPLLDGGSGPLLSKGRERRVEYVGPQRVTTRAGTFDTHHYKLLMGQQRSDGKKPEYELWCTHPDFIVVRAEVRGYLSNATGAGQYELVELES